MSVRSECLKLILIAPAAYIGPAMSTLVAESRVLAAGVTQMIRLTGRVGVAGRSPGQSSGVPRWFARPAPRVRGRFVAGLLGEIAVYPSVVTVRSARDPGWLEVWVDRPR